MTFVEKVHVLNFAHKNRVRSMFFGVIVDSRFEKVRVLIFAHLNRVRSMFLEFLYIVEGGGTPVKRIPEGLF